MNYGLALLFAEAILSAFAPPKFRRTVYGLYHRNRNEVNSQPAAIASSVQHSIQILKTAVRWIGGFTAHRTIRQILTSPKTVTFCT
jgi:hypothetical protein